MDKRTHHRTKSGTSKKISGSNIGRKLGRNIVTHNKSSKPKIKIRNKRDARKFYNKIPVNERMIDQEKAEPIINPKKKHELKKWVDDPTKFDIVGIDDPIPEQTELFIESFERKNIRTSKSNLGKLFVRAINRKEAKLSLKFINKNREKEIGRINIYLDHKNKIVHIDNGEIKRKYRGQGYYPYLRREVMDIADNLGYEVHTIATPYGTARRFQSEEKANKDIVLFYESYDFEAIDNNDLRREARVKPKTINKKYKQVDKDPASEIIYIGEIQKNNKIVSKSLNQRKIETNLKDATKKAKIKNVSKNTIKRLMPHLADDELNFLYYKSINAIESDPEYEISYSITNLHIMDKIYIQKIIEKEITKRKI